MPTDSRTADFADFLTASPTSYHAAAVVADRLAVAGFEPFDERRPWAGATDRGFVVRDGAVIAWRSAGSIGPGTGFRVVGAHTDSPGFKLKPNPSSSVARWQQAGMEVYGGPLVNSWLDRELAVAGRLCTIEGEVRLLRTGPLLRIPQLAPHLDRSVNDSLHLDRQAHLMPIFAVDRPEQDLLTHLGELAGVPRSQWGHFDLFACPTEPPGTFGANDEFLAAPRLDNLSSVFAGLQAFLDADAGPDVAVLACFDHEEVGSASRSGASGPFLADILTRLAASFGLDADASAAMIARSSCISADAGHAVHPNYVNLHDPGNRPVVNGGPLLKINANQRYTTDAVSGSLFIRACRAAGVPFQPFVSNNSVPCGSTIGPLTATRIGMTTVDVGIGLLSMHSAREMCGVQDPQLLARALAAYWAGA